MFSSTQLELEYIKAKKDFLMLKMIKKPKPSKEMIKQLQYLNDLIKQLKSRVDATIE
jgi:hypothetical protein